MELGGIEDKEDDEVWDMAGGEKLILLRSKVPGDYMNGR
jgi:hypothetical protein